MLNICRKNLLSTILLILFVSVFGQDSVTTKAEKKKDFFVFPAFFYSPETSFGFGAVDILYFRTSDNPSARPSSMQNVLIFTLRNQILFTNPYSVFLKDDEYWLNGELGFYHYPYDYYGIGTDLQAKETYTASFLRVELNALKKWSDHLYIGPTLFHDNYFRIKADPDGDLITNNVLGIQGGQLMGFGGSLIWDKRNNLFSPYKGHYLSSRLIKYQDQLIGDYEFLDFNLDARKYFHINDIWETAFQAYHQSVLGDAPFYNYAQLGGAERMRGYFRGAYRDRHYSLLQAEVRRYLTPWLVASVFGGVGSVGDEFLGYDKILGSYGIGLRSEIDPKERVRIRLDYARGYQTSGFYISINEAF
ncbi:MAG: BamA/TamA family outer membrane protein [Cyclobacteriaceae bacterium]